MPAREPRRLGWPVPKLRRASRRLEGAMLGVPEYLRGLAAVAQVSFEAVCRWAGLSPDFRLDRQAAAGWGHLARVLGLSFREAILRLRLALVEDLGLEVLPVQARGEAIARLPFRVSRTGKRGLPPRPLVSIPSHAIFCTSARRPFDSRMLRKPRSRSRPMVFGQRCDTARRRHKPLPIPGGMPCYWFRVWTTGFSNLRRDGSPRGLAGSHGTAPARVEATVHE